MAKSELNKTDIMKDNLKFLSILFILQARMKGDNAIVFPDKPFLLDGKRYVGASVNRDMQLLSRDESEGTTVTGLLTVDGSEDWDDRRWDELRDGILRSTCKGADPAARLTDDDCDMLLRCIDLAFTQGKAVGAKQKRWILTCIDGEGKLVSVESFHTMEDGMETMRKQVLAEQQDLENSGYDAIAYDIHGNATLHAEVTRGSETVYTWDLTGA